MPRVHTLIREIGTSGNLERFAVSEDAAHDIARAVYLEHPCNDSSCDIGTALEEGFPFSAAHLLVGATETPLLDAVMSFHRIGATDDPSDWREWVKWHEEHGRRCDSCGAFTYGDDETECGNCLAPL